MSPKKRKRSKDKGEESHYRVIKRMDKVVKCTGCDLSCLTHSDSGRRIALRNDYDCKLRISG